MIKFLVDIDKGSFRLLNSFAGRNDLLDQFFVFSAEGIIFLLAVCTFLFLWKEYRKGILIIAVSALSALIGRFVFAWLIRDLVFRTRPFLRWPINQLVYHDPLEAAFPSGHAVVMFAIAFAVFQYHKGWGVLFMIAAFWSAVSRVIAGVHFPADVAAGIVVAYVAFLVSKWIVERMESYIASTK